MIRNIFFIAFILCLSLVVSVVADTSFDVTTYGSFKRMKHDASGKAALLSIPRSGGIYGVGALADLLGEILVWDGKVFVTPGESNTGSTRPATSISRATPHRKAGSSSTARRTRWVTPSRATIPRHHRRTSSRPTARRTRRVTPSHATIPHPHRRTSSRSIARRTRRVTPSRATIPQAPRTAAAVAARREPLPTGFGPRFLQHCLGSRFCYGGPELDPVAGRGGVADGSWLPGNEASLVQARLDALLSIHDAATSASIYRIRVRNCDTPARFELALPA